MTDTIEEIRERHDEWERIGFIKAGPAAAIDAHADRATLLRALDEAQEELSIWQSVFPDIAPDRVLPDRSKLEAELLAMAEENARLREALQAIVNNAEIDTDAVLFRAQAAGHALAALKETGQ